MATCEDEELIKILDEKVLINMLEGFGVPTQRAEELVLEDLEDEIPSEETKRALELTDDALEAIQRLEVLVYKFKSAKSSLRAKMFLALVVHVETARHELKRLETRRPEVSKEYQKRALEMRSRVSIILVQASRIQPRGVGKKAIEEITKIIDR